MYMLSLYIFALYPARFISLYTHPESFQFAHLGYTVNFEQVQLLSLVIYFISLICLLKFVPKKLIIEPSIRDIKVLCWIFYFLSFVKIIDALELLNSSILTVFYTSIFSIDFIFFCLLTLKFYNRSAVRSIVLLYVLPAIMSGSKAALITTFAMYLLITLLHGNRLVTFRNFVVLTIVILSYPLLMALSIILRVGVSTKPLAYLAYSYSNIGDISEIIRFALLQISRRISGIDVLMIPNNVNSEIFGPLETSLYLLKGVLTAGLIDTLSGIQSSFGIGRKFAIDFFGQNLTVGNGYEPTLYALVHFSSYGWFSYIIFYLLIILLLSIFKSFINSWFIKLGCIFLFFIIIQVTMNGTILQVTAFMRTFIFLGVSIYIVKSLVIRKSIQRSIDESTTSH